MWDEWGIPILLGLLGFVAILTIVFAIFAILEISGLHQELLEFEKETEQSE